MIYYVFFSVVCLLCLCARMFICALWSPAGKGLTYWLSFVVSNCEFFTFPWYRGSGMELIVSIPDLYTLTYYVYNNIEASISSENPYARVNIIYSIININLKKTRA